MPVKKWVFGAFILVFAATAATSVCQNEPAEASKPVMRFDSAYIADYTGELTTRLFLLYQNATFFLNPAGDNIPKIVYRPNVNIRTGIAGFWKWFGLGLSIDNPFYKTDQAAYGKTTTLDLRVNAFGRSVAGELFMQQYRGYYILTPEKPGGSHYKLPDMRTFSIGFSGYWIVHANRFSIRAAFIQNEVQRRSAGSIIVRPSFLYYKIFSGHGIIPQALADTFGIPAVKQLVSGRFYSIGISPGYAYTLVFLKNLYLTAALFPGIALQFSSFDNVTGRQSGYAWNVQLSGRFAVGYNSEKWFLGGSIQTGFNEVPVQVNNALFSYDIAQFRFWGGMRFNMFRKKHRTSPLK